MNELRKSLISYQNFEPKEGQRKLLRSSKDLIRCPSLDYKYVVSSELEVDRAFDILFEETMKLNEK
jgi:hypothetical protein